MARVGNHLIMVADEDTAALTLLEQDERDGQCRFIHVSDEAQLFDHLQREAPDLLLLDYRFAGRDCLQLLPELLRDHLRLRVVVLTTHGSIDNAVRAIKLGAFEYITKPIDPQRLREVLYQLDDAPALSASMSNGVPTIDQLEKQAILAALRETGGKVREAARLLGYGQATVYRKIKRYKITLENRAKPTFQE